MENLRVKGFRSINDSGIINIKPITAFLGKNSCGKSTFIRLFPLIKQTLEKNRQEPLLWYGDYVDFGDFNNILPINSEADTFGMAFDMKLYDDYDRREYPLILRRRHARFLFNPKEEVDVHIELEYKKQMVSRMKIQYEDQFIECVMDSAKNVVLTINGTSANVADKIVPSNMAEGLLPMVVYQFDQNERSYYRGIDIVLDPVVKIIRDKITKRVSEDSLHEHIRNLLALESQQELLEKIRSSFPDSVARYFKEKDIDDNIFQLINNRIVFAILPYLIDAINSCIKSDCDKTFYIKPLRAKADRYYRVQGISTKNVDSDGANLPMLLYNLKDEVREQFSEWTERKLGLYFSVKQSEGHISLVVGIDKKEYVNLADAGYGYSQVLPILLQLWLLKNERTMQSFSNEDNYLVIIEQPELHLHPAFQARLMELFVSLIKEMKEYKINLKILFETHSETMINRLGELIKDRMINRQDVNVVMVEKKEGISLFTQSSYDEDGYIEKWPIGFLSPED